MEHCSLYSSQLGLKLKTTSSILQIQLTYTNDKDVHKAVYVGLFELRLSTVHHQFGVASSKDHHSVAPASVTKNAATQQDFVIVQWIGLVFPGELSLKFTEDVVWWFTQDFTYKHRTHWVNILWIYIYIYIYIQNPRAYKGEPNDEPTIAKARCWTIAIRARETKSSMWSREWRGQRNSRGALACQIKRHLGGRPSSVLEPLARYYAIFEKQREANAVFLVINYSEFRCEKSEEGRQWD